MPVIRRRIPGRSYPKGQKHEPHYQTHQRKKLGNAEMNQPLLLFFKRDLAITPTRCVLYDNRLMIPAALKQLIINALHQTHPGQTGMLRLADLVWFPQIHWDVTAKAKSCIDCIKKGKNLKPLIPKQSQGILPKLSEPNEEVQIDFAGPIPFRENKQNYYILVSVSV